MRELKFRVWNIEEKQWDEPSKLEVFDSSGRLRHLYDHEENYVIQQFTGLKDSAGKEIFEGDIVKIIIDSNYMNAGTYIAPVEFENGRFYAKNKFGMNFIGDKCSFYPGLGGDNCEIVGNIFENEISKI